MPDRQYVKLSVEERVAVVTIDHPPANALDAVTLAELDAVISEVGADANIKAVVITGAGQFAFSTGADINTINRIASPDEARALVLKGQTILNKIEALRKPVIAAINAWCLGGGNELAMACHMRVASDRARFGQPECNLGLVPGFGGTQRLPRLVGKAKALELLLTGDVFPAQEAYRIGLVNKLVPEGDVVKAARDLAKRIVAKSSASTSLTMEAVEQGMQTSLADGLLVEAGVFARVMATEDAKEGITAFLQKRQPKFQDK